MNMKIGRHISALEDKKADSFRYPPSFSCFIRLGNQIYSFSGLGEEVRMPSRVVGGEELRRNNDRFSRRLADQIQSIRMGC